MSKSLLENSLAMGFRTKVDVLEFDYIPASADVATELDVPRGQEIQMNVRVRQLEVSAVLTSNDLSAARGRKTYQPAGPRRAAHPHSVGETGHSGYPRRANDFGRSRPARCGGRTPSRGRRAAAQNRKARDRRTSGRPVEFIRGLYRPDLYRYQMKLQRVQKSKARMWRTIDQPPR